LGLYILLLSITRIILIITGFNYSKCPKCKKTLRKKRRNKILRISGFLTINILSFRKVSCTKCNYQGPLLRKIRLVHYNDEY
jgi:predicted nucleic-acid-binding Zn-ribbon protein